LNYKHKFTTPHNVSRTTYAFERSPYDDGRADEGKTWFTRRTRVLEILRRSEISLNLWLPLHAYYSSTYMYAFILTTGLNFGTAVRSGLTCEVYIYKTTCSLIWAVDAMFDHAGPCGALHPEWTNAVGSKNTVRFFFV